MSDAPYSDVRQMTPEAQRHLGAYVCALLGIEADLEAAILAAGRASNPGIDKLKTRLRADLIALYAEK